MNHFFSRPARTVSAVAASVLAACCLTACSEGRADTSAALRVNQVGYVSGEKKFAYVMGDRQQLADAGFEVLDERGTPPATAVSAPRSAAGTARTPPYAP